MMKAGAVGRLGNVTKLLQRERRDSQWRMQNFVNGGAFPPFSEEEPTGRRSGPSGGITPWKFLKSAASQSPSKNARSIILSLEKLPRRRRRNKKAQLSLTNPRDACEKFARFT